MHELGGEKERASLGPRELLEKTRVRLAQQQPGLVFWGAGACVSSPEEAAQFATAGYTWFRLDMARVVDLRADTLPLEAMDATIVALEDLGIFAPGWYTAYVDQELTPVAGANFRLPDETLARAAVKFAPVFARAQEIEQVIRNCWSGRGEPPDLEIVLSPGGPASTAEEMLFASMELRWRLSSVTAIAPALGHEWEPGQDPSFIAGTLTHALSRLSSALCPARLSAPHLLGHALPDPRLVHQDTMETGRLAFLAQLIQRDPALFREWLEGARLAFPIARSGWPITLSEEEARFLPQVEDAELAATFLDLPSGRQLLLSTWSDVSSSSIGERARALLG